MISTVLRERHERVEVPERRRGEEVRREGEVVDRQLLLVLLSSNSMMSQIRQESNSSKLDQLDRRLELAVRRLLDQSRGLDRTQQDLRLRFKLRRPLELQGTTQPKRSKRLAEVRKEKKGRRRKMARTRTRPSAVDRAKEANRNLRRDRRRRKGANPMRPEDRINSRSQARGSRAVG